MSNISENKVKELINELKKLKDGTGFHSNPDTKRSSSYWAVQKSNVAMSDDLPLDLVKEFLDESQKICPVQVLDYNRSERVFDNSIFYQSFVF